MWHHRRSRVLLALIVGAFVLCVAPVSAFADISSPPSGGLGTSTTNPSDDEDPGVWRRGWGNTVFPEFTLNLPSGTSSTTFPQVRGLIYTVDRNEFTEIDETRPQDYDHALDPSGATLGHTLDLPGILAGDPLGLAATESGARLPIEGWWWFHWSFYDVEQVATTTITGGFGIDVTPPLAVSKMSVKPYVGYTGPSGVWMPNQRAFVAWEDKEYDGLSGTAAYEIYVNGERLMAGGAPAYVYHLDHVYTSFTLEHLKNGKNEITVKAVDRATNVSHGVSSYYYVDSDEPSLTVTAPKAGALVGKSTTFAATATDGAGIQYVQFYIDGKLVFTDTAAPYALTKDMSAYANGKHQFTVKTKDKYGREKSETRDITLDKTPPVLSYVSDSPDPFYPVLQDGYYDLSTIKFYSSEKVYAYVYFYKANGTVFTGRSAPRGPGWGTIGWNGRDANGAVGLGTFGYRVVLQDAAGNQTWGSVHSCTIRNYEIVRISRNAVKVIPR